MRSSLVRHAVTTALALLGTLPIGCGSSHEQPPASPKTEATPEPVAQPDAKAEPPPDAAAAGADEPETKPAPREIRYVVTSEGLEVHIEGVRFLVSAEAQKVAGGWGVKLKASAVSQDGEAHSLLRSEQGAFAFAGSVERASGAERFSDTRHGDGETTIEPNKRVELTGTWPAKSGPKPLAKGDTLDLQVGLWGIGASAEERRPVRSFCRVQLKAQGNTPRALLEPPPTAEQQSR